MKRLQGRARDYAWGSDSVIPSLFGYPPASSPVAEVWLGAHPNDPSRVDCSDMEPLFDPAQLYPALYPKKPAGQTLADYISSDASGILGEEIALRSGRELPYLLKIIAPAEPLSLQVHPSIDQAIAGYAAEDAAGVPRDSPERNYKDANHKPELVYALTRFDALAGFRAPRRIAEVLRGLHTDLTDNLRKLVLTRGVREAFQFAISEDTRPSHDQIAQVAAACASRIALISPSRRADATVELLFEKFPDDPGVVASLLLNPVTLRPGEALFVPAGTVHAYLHGTAIEIMAASDNVLRAGLTPKHVDVPELLRIVRPEAAPPVRIAPERISKSMSVLYAPVDDFELAIFDLRDANVWVSASTVWGPRTVVCLDGAAQLEAGGQRLTLNAGQAAFVPDSDGKLDMRGFGRLVVASVP